MSSHVESRLRTYAQLCRLPNVFTALADVTLGYLLVHRNLEPVITFALVAATSALLYTAGMVLNDVFDVETDRRERSKRPIPAGRIELAAARRLGFGLLIGGIATGVLASLTAGTLRPALVAAALACAVLAYDVMLKNTAMAPVGMGACRFLNVLLGTSAAVVAWHPMLLTAAAGVGVFVAGVTWFARTEATVSNRLLLASALVVMTMGIAIVAVFPFVELETVPRVAFPEPALRAGVGWFYVWIALAALVLWRAVAAVWDPQPAAVQFAVAHAILSIISIDAMACYAVRGMFWATMILLLALPAIFLRRWIAMT